MGSGRWVIFFTMASRARSAPCPSGRRGGIVKRVVRSTSIPIADLLAALAIESPSQRPGSARPPASAGRSPTMAIGVPGARRPSAPVPPRLARPLRDARRLGRAREAHASGYDLEASCPASLLHLPQLVVDDPVKFAAQRKRPFRSRVLQRSLESVGPIS